MDFSAIDVEIANPDLASVCQIGVVQFAGGKVSRCWKTLVNPGDYFSPANVRIHGVDEDSVRTAPTFTDVKPELDCLLESTVVCCHTPFDRHSISAVHAKHRLTVPAWTWLDTALVVRRAWPDRASSGYGLRPVAEMLGISFRHHDAEEDARAAGEILLHAIAKTGLSVDDWLARVGRPVTASASGYDSGGGIARTGNPEGPLFGETVVFTGALSFPRREAAALAAEAGCQVAENVTKQTTLLVVGEQDLRALQGHERSSKHRRAEELIAHGQDIRILQEQDFLDLVSTLRPNSKPSGQFAPKSVTGPRLRRR